MEMSFPEIIGIVLAGGTAIYGGRYLPKLVEEIPLVGNMPQLRALPALLIGAAAWLAMPPGPIRLGLTAGLLLAGVQQWRNVPIEDPQVMDFPTLSGNYHMPRNNVQGWTGARPA